MNNPSLRPASGGSGGHDPHAAHRKPLPHGTPAHIGRYETLRELGNGTFGRVFLASDPVLGRLVAIKMPKDQLAPDAHHEFLREARVIADIRHTNICTVYDAGVHGEFPYIVMQYVSGGTLNDAIENVLLKPTDSLRFVTQIARGLEAAHARGVIHRDLKPANVLRDTVAGELLLTDFGIARWLGGSAATTNNVKGSPGFMAPEQWGPNGQFGPISARTDIYSLGVVLFRLFTGMPLFTGDLWELMAQHCTTPPRRPSELRPDLDPRLDDLCMKALAKQPADRYPSAKAFAEAAEEAFRVVTAVPVVQQATRWHVAVRGAWSARPAGNADARWQEAIATPVDVTTHAGETYQLRLASDIQDAELVALANLASLTALQTLDFTWCTQLTNAGLAHLKPLRAIHTLHLSGCKQITDAGLVHLKPLTALQTLNLRDCKLLTGTGLAHLQPLTALQSLILTWCDRLTNEGLAHLRSLSALQSLNLGGCTQITDAGLLNLRSLPLRTLSLHGCTQITDTGLVNLRSFAGLQTLHLSGCKQVTAGGIADLKRAMPNCTISH